MSIESEEELENLLKDYDDLILDSRGIIQLHPAKFYHELDYYSLIIWCRFRAIYQMPTIELVDWLATKFNLEQAIELYLCLEYKQIKKARLWLVRASYGEKSRRNKYIGTNN